MVFKLIVFVLLCAAVTGTPTKDLFADCAENQTNRGIRRKCILVPEREHRDNSTFILLAQEALERSTAVSSQGYGTTFSGMKRVALEYVPGGIVVRLEFHSTHSQCSPPGNFTGLTFAPLETEPSGSSSRESSSEFGSKVTSWKSFNEKWGVKHMCLAPKTADGICQAMFLFNDGDFLLEASWCAPIAQAKENDEEDSATVTP